MVPSGEGLRSVGAVSTREGVLLPPPLLPLFLEFSLLSSQFPDSAVKK